MPSILHILKSRSLHTPNQKVFTFLEAGESAGESLTFEELHRKAHQLSTGILKFSSKGDRVLLLLPQGIDFIVTFYACMICGVIAVPCSIPTKRERLNRTKSIIDNASPTLVIGTPQLINRSIPEAGIFDQANCHWVTLDQLDSDNFLPEDFHYPDDDTIAYLQYTSGSTGNPKGTIITHENIVHNLASFQDAFQHDHDTVCVSWLPFFHDMGLVYGLMQPVFNGYHCFVMSPLSFMQNPICWLRAISDFKATHTVAPNFGYELCASIPESQKEGLDLSSWKVAINGSEFIRSATLKKFTNAYKSYGWDENSFCPGYGLAEATLMVTALSIGIAPRILEFDFQNGANLPEGIENQKQVVGCGYLNSFTEVKIVHPATSVLCKDGDVGEIWLAGKNIAPGYWNNDQETTTTFRAMIKGSKQPYLRTGDLGFILDQQLFVVGRIKELIILNGQNFYPTDLEQLAESCDDAIKDSGVCAFSFSDGIQEKVVLVCEIKRSSIKELPSKEVAKKIISRLIEELGVRVSAICFLPPLALPRTTSGKIQRLTCKSKFLNKTLSPFFEWEEKPIQEEKQLSSAGKSEAEHESVRNWLIGQVAEVCAVDSSEIKTDEPLSFYGMDSNLATRLALRVKIHWHKAVSPTLFYNFPTIDALTEAISNFSEKPNHSQLPFSTPDALEPVAIIGMGCRFPGADNLEEFWQFLESGGCAITSYPEARWGASTENIRKEHPSVNYGGMLSDIDQFDPAFFGITPREAIQMDPQQRLLLEVVWESLQDAGIRPASLQKTKTGVYVGISTNEYAGYSLNESASAHAVTGIALSIAASRISYLLDLKGPALAIDTACSSSLVALHRAVKDLQYGEVDLAIIGGVNLLLNPIVSVIFDKAGMLSTKGRCKTFDATADGYVRSEGCGVIVLKRKAEAIADHNHIRAIVRGSAINQDGKSNGITAPNGRSQVEVIRQALHAAQISENDISFFEAHGTGTPLGDPIEVNALKEVLESRKPEAGECWLSSVKANIGHLEAAAGVAGLIKAVLCLSKKTIPAQVNYTELNPEINLADGTSLNIPVTLTRLPPEKPLYAGVSSFGFGGTNAHVILENAPDAPIETIGDDRHELVLLSARTKTALKELVRRYYMQADRLTATGMIRLSCSTLFSRELSRYTIGIAARDPETLKVALLSYPDLPEGNAFVVNQDTHSKQRVAWVFTGQGSQYAGMGNRLYQLEPVFKAAIDDCAQILQQFSFDLPGVLFRELPDAIHETQHAQPAIFSIEYGLARLLQHWGVKPDVLIGHSIGEYVAACISGILTLHDALKMISLRASLMQQMPPGGMAVVFAHESHLAAILPSISDRVSIAAYNTPNSIVVSGEKAALETVYTFCNDHQIPCKPLTVSHAFHSPMTNSIQQAFEEGIGNTRFSPAGIPVISTMTGMEVEAEMGTPAYWTQHIRKPVLFREGIQLAAQNHQLFIEIGPKAQLQSLILENAPEAVVYPAITGKGEDDRDLCLLAGRLYVHKQAINWQAVFGNRLSINQVILPLQPYDKESYWIQSAAKAEHPSLAVRYEPPGVPELKTRDIEALSTLISEVLHIPTDRIDPHTALTSLGADSIMLLELIKKIKSKFQVDITIRQLFAELSSLHALANYIQEQAPSVENAMPVTSFFAAPAVNSIHPIVGSSGATGAGTPDASLNALFQKQLDLVNQTLQKQFELLARPGQDQPDPNPQKKPSISLLGQLDPKLSVTNAKLNEDRELTPRQQIYFNALLSRYTQKTGGSKRHAALAKTSHADWLYSIDFRLATKEFLYPIISKKAYDARFVDIDDNEYIDLGMGYGVNFFGNNPAFVKRAIADQLEHGQEIATQNMLASQIAHKICGLTGQERLTYLNSGTEAVMTAIRIARTVTQKNKIVIFNGYYHGTYDGNLAQADPDSDGAMPSSTGIPQSLIHDVVLLNYGQASAIAKIRQMASEIAAVIIEPVQSRKPEGFDQEFLQELRTVTEAHNIALVFDEIITGFRVHAGGMRAITGIRADLTTYGKVIGGGMPIGLVAGSARFMDAIDGGPWNYGDDSFPKSVKTFFGGTFCKHPLTLAAINAAADKLIEEGPALHDKVNALAARIQEELNDFFRNTGVPMKIVRYASLFRFISEGSYNMLFRPIEMDIFFYSLMEKGIFTWERRICFLSTAHTTDEVVTIIEKVKETVYEMLEGGFFPEANQLNVPGLSKKLPLTAIQKQLYLLSTVNEGASVASQLRMTLKCTGPLDAGLMERAVQMLVDRHEALRIKFAPNGDYQEILSELRAPFEVLKMPADAPDPQHYLQKFLIREAEDAFDLHKEPLFRVRLLKISPQLAYLSITAHHLVADGWSMGVIAKDLGDLYSNLLHPDSHPLIEPQPFSAYLHKLQSPEQVKKIKTQKGYWQNKLDGKVPTRLPFIKNKGRNLDYSGNRIRKRLPESLLTALRTRSNEQGTTLFMSLYAVFSALLHKLTGNPELFIGVPSAGRSFGTDQFMAGSCADTIVIAHEINPDRPFNQYLNQTKALLTEAYEHQDCTFSYVKDDLHLKGSNNIRIVFNLDSHVQLPEFYGIEAELAYSPIRHAQFDLLFDLSLIGEAIQIECDYSTALFEEADIQQFIALFENTLQAVMAQPAMRIADISVMGVNELDLLLRRFNQTKTPIDLKLPVQDRFEGTARQFPNHIALAFDSRKITYADLDKQANRLANHLIESYGLQKGSPIAVLEDHSIEQTIALLAILKAGGVYVPVDPGFDSKVIQTIFKEAGILCVLLNSHFADRISQNSTIARLLLDQPLHLPVAADRKPGISFSEDDTACLIFSSEQSYGISISHAGLVNAVLDQMAQTGLKEKDTFLQVLSVADGNSILNSFSALLSGATLHAIPSHFAMNVPRFLGYLDQYQITALGTTPSYLRLLFQGSPLPSLQKIISSGEALRVQDARPFTETTHKLLFNKYGSPEVAISAALYKVTTRDLEAGIVPIGGPGANKQFYVLNEAGELQPIGVPGELAIGGLGIASAYLNNPRLTSEKFISLPFVPQEKLFLTGDMAKWLPDGRLVFTGKKADWHQIDSQLVNLFEIEAHLLEHPLVEDAQVIYDTQEGGGHLVAFVRESRHKSGNGQEKLSPESLKSFLHKSLPGRMVPKQVVVLETIPLTLQLKSDRKKLRAIASDHVSANSSLFRTAGSLTESIILDIWKEVLEMDRISLDANYFEIGGQSLKGMQIGFRIKDKFGIPITLKEFIEYPTISAMAEWVDRAINKPVVVPVPLQPESRYYPVSLTQKRLWTLIQIEGAHHNYNLFGAFSVEGDLNKHALEQTIRTLVQRHEILRTTFELQEDELVQKVHSFESFKLEIAYNELGSEEEQVLLEILRREELHQFDVAQGPLFKVGLIKNADQKHILYLNLHHIIADGWSLEVIKSELDQLYSAYVAGRENTLAPLALQYRHYAQRQIELLKSGSLASDRQYWLNKFQPVPPRLNLPIDAPARPSAKAYQGARESRLLTHAVSSAIYELGKAKQVTPFMILISGVSALLNRYTHTKQMVLGTSVLGRNEKDLENQIGFYINLLALGIEVDDQKGFNDLLVATRTTLLDALAHQDYPFDMLADDLAIERDLSFAPLFDVYVSINDNRESNFTLNGLVFKPLETRLTSSKYDLSFNFEETPGAIKLEIEYDTKLFSQDKILAVLEHFERLLACCLANGEAPLWNHDYVSDEEKQTLLETFHGGNTPIPAAISIPAFFEKAVQENQDRIALIDGAVCLSYAQFDQMTNQFARYLIEEAGVVAGDRIIIMTAPGHQMVLGLFSILKAGAVYVPVDPSYPADRIARIYEACTPRTILTDTPDYENLDGLSSLQIPGHADWGMLGKYSLEKLPVTVLGEDLAYIIYTSGSTGTPKGVMIRHKSVYNTINWMWEALQFDKSDIVLQKTSFTFDVSVWEFFMTLCYGARLVCCPKELSYDMELLHNYIGEQEITSLSFVPSALVVYQDYLSRQKEKIKSPLKRIIAAGEALKPQTVKAHYQLFSNTLYNLYGPTEATIYVSYYEPTPLDEIVPIGKPIFNTALLVLDNYRQLCPVGIPGEIAIGGIGLAEGYYHNQELTDKAFVDHPYRKGEKLYLTGDIGKMLKDGNLAYLGRKDHQIKLRGFRIELGEIETMLSQHEQINEAVVLLSEGASPFLVAYVSIKHPVTASELKTYLNGKLPSYMVPSAFIFMDQFPINSNGKIDRKALLKTDALQVSPAGNSVLLQEGPSAGNGKTNYGAFNATKPIEGLPSNNLELQMLLVWEKVLHSRIEDIRSLQAAFQSDNGQQHISVTDNFFKIGGDSYLAVKLSTLIKKELKLNIEVRHLFEYPSIRALCEFAGERIFEYAPIPLQESRPFYPASPAQRRFFLMQELSTDKARFNLYASLWLRGPLEVEALQQALALLIARHESLRTSFLEVDGEVKQLIHPIDVLPSAFVYEDFSAHPDAEKEALKAIKINGIYTFDLSEAPLIHLHLIKVGAEKHTLIVNIHHIICDEWSLEVFVGELKSLYQSILRGLPSSLTPLPAQYKDFVVWQEASLKVEREKLRAYWLGLFAKGAPQLMLPLDFPRPANRSSEGTEFREKIPAKRLEEISRILEKEDATFNMFFTAAVTFFLHKITGQEDIVIGTPVSGRIHPDTEHQIGLFINTLTLYNKVNPDASFAVLLQSVRQNTLQAQEHQLYPFDELVNDLLETREEGRNPLFDVWMVYHNAAVSERGFDRLSDEVTMSPIEDGVVLSRYDLKFDFIKTPTEVDLLFETSNDLFMLDTSLKLFQSFKTSLNFFIDHFQERPSDYLNELPVVPVNALEPGEPAPIKKIGKRSRKQ